MVVRFLDKESKDFIGRYIEEYLEEINFFVKQNNLEWVIKDKGGKAYLIAERVTTEAEPQNQVKD